VTPRRQRVKSLRLVATKPVGVLPIPIGRLHNPAVSTAVLRFGTQRLYCETGSMLI